MTIRDWPTGDVFKAASFSLSLDSNQSTARGFYTGNTQAIGHADRLRGIITLPPSIDLSAGARREAFMLWWKSSRGQVRIPMPHRKYPNGTVRGTATAAASAIAGARSISLTGCTSSNLAIGGSFEFDANSDGLADGWSSFSEGSVSGVTYGRAVDNPIDGVYEQYVSASSLGTTYADRAGIYRLYALPTPATTLTLSVRIRGFGGATGAIIAKCETLTGTVLGYIDVASAVATSTPQRIGGAFTPISGTEAVTVLLFETMRTGVGTARTVAFDGLCLSYGAPGNAWPGRATALGGDFLGIGGNLLAVDYDGAEANDRGEMTVPLSLPLQKAVSNGAAVTWNAPTGLWELDDEGLQLDYSAGNLQGGFAIPVRQVIA